MSLMMKHLHQYLPPNSPPPWRQLSSSQDTDKKMIIVLTLLLKIKLLDPSAKPPERGSNNAAGLDMYIHISTIILPGKQGKIDTKVAMVIPLGHHGQLFVCSTYALKYQARVEAGTIDSDYHGEIFIIISNNGPDLLIITKGDILAQLIITKDPSYSVEIAESLDETQRNDGAFGSTGKMLFFPQQDNQINPASSIQCQLLRHLMISNCTQLVTQLQLQHYLQLKIILQSVM